MHCYRLTAIAAAAVVVLAVLLSACGQPDTNLHPDKSAVAFAPLQHPFAGAALYVDGTTQAARWQASHHKSGWLDPITKQPQAHWLNNPEDVAGVPALARQADRQHSLLVLVAYFIPNRDCDLAHYTGATASGFDQAKPEPRSYATFINGLVAALGTTQAVIVMEPDAVAAHECWSAERATVLREAIKRLAAAKQFVYLDAGHPDWLGTGDMAQRLIDAGINEAEGFALNTSAREPNVGPADNPAKGLYGYGEELSSLLGGRQYVIDTSRNGAPVTSGDWCNSPGQGLGARPGTLRSPAGAPNLAANLWVKEPGASDGNYNKPNPVDFFLGCHGETLPPGVFSPDQARALIAHASPPVLAAS
mgnify:CR=1 FL=1